MKRNLLVTGKPRSGKTTLIMDIVKELDIPFCGFYTSELLREDKRVGFVINNLKGERGIFAHVDSESDLRISKYGVEVDVLETVGVSEVERCLRDNDLKIIVIDEIGKMELFSEKFKSTVEKSLASRYPLLATVMIKSDEWLEKVLDRDDIQTYYINMNNRGQVKEKIKIDLLGLLNEEFGVEFNNKSKVVGGKK